MIRSLAWLAPVAIVWLSCLWMQEEKSQQSDGKSGENVPQQAGSDNLPRQDPQTPEELAQATAREVVQRMMRATHRGAYSPLVIFKQAVKSDEDPEWDRLKPMAEWVRIMGVALAESPQPNQQSYLDLAVDLQSAVRKKNRGSLKTAVQRWAQSCTRCHGWGPPR